jgi:hypothetical protein
MQLFLLLYVVCICLTLDIHWLEDLADLHLTLKVEKCDDNAEK